MDVGLFDHLLNLQVASKQIVVGQFTQKSHVKRKKCIIPKCCVCHCANIKQHYNPRKSLHSNVACCLHCSEMGLLLNGNIE